MDNILTPEGLSDISKQNYDPTPGFFIRHWAWILGLILLFPLLMGFFLLFGFIHIMADHGPVRTFFIFHGDTIAYILCLAIYLSKDALNGQSLAKRTVRLQIVNNTTGIVASPMQTLVRNLTCIIWPVELIMMCVNPSRRLGDKIANTRLERYGIYTITQRKYKLKHTIPVFLISLAIPTAGYLLYKFIETFFQT